MIELVGTYDSLDRLFALASRASKTVQMLTTPALELVAGWHFFTTDREQWWGMLFELAWSGCQPLLNAERNLWICPTADCKTTLFCPYDLHRVRSVRDTWPRYREKYPAVWADRLPDLYISDIADVADASAKAIDYLAGEVNGQDSRKDRSPAGTGGGKTPRDDDDDYAASKWFIENARPPITADELRKAYKRGHIKRQQRGAKRAYNYSTNDARKYWPERFRWKNADQSGQDRTRPPN